MRQVKANRVPSLIIGCRSDTLTTPSICAEITETLGGQHLQLEGSGHMWMLNDWPHFRAILAR